MSKVGVFRAVFLGAVKVGSKIRTKVVSWLKKPSTRGFVEGAATATIVGGAVEEGKKAATTGKDLTLALGVLVLSGAVLVSVFKSR